MTNEKIDVNMIYMENIYMKVRDMLKMLGIIILRIYVLKEGISIEFLCFDKNQRLRLFEFNDNVSFIELQY